jgi:hypothetical protein
MASVLWLNNLVYKHKNGESFFGPFLVYQLNVFDKDSIMIYRIRVMILLVNNIMFLNIKSH